MFFLDTLFAMISGGIALVIPLVIHYVTTTLVYEAKDGFYEVTDGSVLVV